MSELQFNTWSVLILIGAAQGIFLAVLLLAKRENRRANKWLGFLLAVTSIHLLEYAADITGITMRFPGLIAITYPLLFCMGPFYYMYCRALLDKNYVPGMKSSLHFIPAVIVLLLMLPFYMMPGEDKIGFILGLAEGNTIKIPAGQLVFMAAHVVQTAVYILLAARFIRKKEHASKTLSSDTSLINKLNWLRTFSLCFSGYFFLYLVLVILLSFIDAYQMQVDYVMLLITSFSLFAIGYYALSNPAIFQGISEPGLQSPELPGIKKETEEKRPNRFPELRDSLPAYMETNKPYLKTDLKIAELADMLSVPSHQLSQFINDEFRLNFYDFINRYRVEEAKKMLTANTPYKILAIAYEVGFNSKATFNRVFKKHTGLTPSEFKGQSASPASVTQPLQG